jgi:hypothetical protein
LAAAQLTTAPREHWNVFDSMVIRWRLAGSGREAQLRSPSELRAGSEPAAGFAAGHATPQQRGMLIGAVMEMAVHGCAGDLQAYLTADILADVADRTTLTGELAEGLAGGCASGGLATTRAGCWSTWPPQSPTARRRSPMLRCWPISPRCSGRGRLNRSRIK